MLKLLTIIDTVNCKLVCVAGDFNIDLLKCDTLDSYNLFLNNMLSHSLLPSISKATKVSNLAATFFDNIFMKSKTTNYSSAIIYSDISDHYPTITQIELPCNSQYQEYN